MIKRPVLEVGGGKLLIGFQPELYAKSISTKASLTFRKLGA
jgi:hypothetical protein